MAVRQGLVRRFHRAVEASLAERFDEINQRIDQSDGATHELGQLVEDLRRRLVDVEEGLAQLLERLSVLEQVVDALVPGLDRLEKDVDRLGPHMASVEERLADLDFDAQVMQADAGPHRSQIEVLAAEHRRINARLQAISSYEERLRRLEGASRSAW